MSKAYSNKALPPGTVLREWRLEGVLGVGGFGIVYKGRGIYFNELVAIKEYFPSSISDRNEDDTVVPVDSDAEEVHALGLKKFVEEAKLLWNLSTPTRHPNIVNVRSLFEVHGTAYMVMDFEDGQSLSKMLKKGQRFNELSLTNIVRPIAEGLERAHRVGVLHRDIKPPNILINEDGRPVLIDFGSARFESADATSTKVTFHTPPYAAIEQYVKTYDQGPWTDIYALGVVLYECVTGEKPAEVLERLHGASDKPLAQGKWPGYSRKFLAAIDAAMIIKPAERPQSIAEWLALLDDTTEADRPFVESDEATRVVAYADGPAEILPVAPPLPGFAQGEKIDTGIPEDPKEVKFRRAGEDTNGTAIPVAGEAPGVEAPESSAGTGVPAGRTKRKGSGPEELASPAESRNAAAGAGGGVVRLSKVSKPILIGSAAVLALAVAGGSWMAFGGSRTGNIDSALLPGAEGAAGMDDAGGETIDSYSAGVKALLADARQSGAPVGALNALSKAADELDRFKGQGGTDNEGRVSTLDGLVRSAAAAFATVLRDDAQQKARRLGNDVAWANVANPSSAAGETGNRRSIAASLRKSLTALRGAVASTTSNAAPSDSLDAARQALAEWRNFGSGSIAAYRAQGAAVPAIVASEVQLTAGDQSVDPAPASAPSQSEVASGGVSRGKTDQFKTVVSRANGVANQVIRLGSRDRPGSNATDDEREGYRIRQADRDTAREYERYLDNLEASMRGAKSDGEADRLISLALQTEDYLRNLLARSSGTLD